MHKTYFIIHYFFLFFFSLNNWKLKKNLRIKYKNKIDDPLKINRIHENYIQKRYNAIVAYNYASRLTEREESSFKSYEKCLVSIKINFLYTFKVYMYIYIYTVCAFNIFLHTHKMYVYCVQHT